MSTTTQGAGPLTPPAGRYGADPETTERRTKRWYQVFAGLLILVTAAVAAAYIFQSSVNGEVEAFQVVSPRRY
ncbi:hypothetical protein GXW82_28870 [Streptacidiphilus sp. 4-A2]|nr:hypothetical protein [Streptacidiphilus sp. 4-A2]